MTQTNTTIDLRKGKHLSYAERCHIAKVLGQAPQTIHNEIHRGIITQLKRQKQNGSVYDYYQRVYDADVGQAFYEKQRLNYGRRPKWAETDVFIDWADDKILTDRWPPDTVIGFATLHKLFDSTTLPCTTTLYQWIERGVMKTTNMDLLEKLSRKPKRLYSTQRSNKRVLGKSIDERPRDIDSRKTFGHWEIDTVMGNRSKSDAVLLTLAERQTRFEVILKFSGKDAQSVNQAILALRERAGNHFDRLFKTLTSDNGSEFAGIDEALKDVTDVYFSHSYASWERGTSENQHKFIRRFIPKGNPISEVSESKILRIQRWMNDYPRKILGYQTPHETFVKAIHQEAIMA